MASASSLPKSQKNYKGEGDVFCLPPLLLGWIHALDLWQNHSCGQFHCCWCEDQAFALSRWVAALAAFPNHPNTILPFSTINDTHFLGAERPLFLLPPILLSFIYWVWLCRVRDVTKTLLCLEEHECIERDKHRTRKGQGHVWSEISGHNAPRPQRDAKSSSRVSWGWGCELSAKPWSVGRSLFKTDGNVEGKFEWEASPPD